MTYQQMREGWPEGFRHDEATMSIVREHGRREHVTYRKDCPICVRFAVENVRHSRSLRALRMPDA